MGGFFFWASQCYYYLILYILFLNCHNFEIMLHVCVIGIRSWAKAEAATRRTEVSKAKYREQSPAAPAAHQRPGKAASEGTKFVTDCLLITFNNVNFYLTLFQDMGSDCDPACFLQDLTELHKERQCLEKQHQQEVNKLNQELQQARTLYNGLQAQADKVNIKSWIRQKNKACKAVLETIHLVWLFFPQLCYFLLSVLFLFPLLYFIPGFLAICTKVQRYFITYFMTSFAPCFTALLCVFLLCFPPSTLLSASSSSRFLSNGKVKLWR